MKHLITRFVREDEGQDLVEYALLIAFIALACIIGLQQLGTAINTTYNSISSASRARSARQHLAGPAGANVAGWPVANEVRWLPRRGEVSLLRRFIVEGRRAGLDGVRLLCSFVRSWHRGVAEHRHADRARLHDFNSGTQSIWETPDP
jgi:pilus assembly protein Flp/PilA